MIYCLFISYLCLCGCLWRYLCRYLFRYLVALPESKKAFASTAAGQYLIFPPPVRHVKQPPYVVSAYRDQILSDGCETQSRRLSNGEISHVGVRWSSANQEGKGREGRKNERTGQGLNPRLNFTTIHNHSHSWACLNLDPLLQSTVARLPLMPRLLHCYAISFAPSLLCLNPKWLHFARSCYHRCLHLVFFATNG